MTPLIFGAGQVRIRSAFWDYLALKLNFFFVGLSLPPPAPSPPLSPTLMCAYGFATRTNS